MHASAALFSLFFLGVVLLDAFQTIVLPRRPVGRIRITRIFFLATWGPWRLLAKLFRSRGSREQMYSVYGPFSLLMLFVVWAALLTTGFGLMFFGIGDPLNDPMHPVTQLARLRSCFYFSGTALFTLGLGDVEPADHFARFLVIVEAGVGLGFVALVIGYLPVLYTAFSTREISVALLDARAGSPPTAGELLMRHTFEGGNDALTGLLAEWERWCAEMLETHISYPILCYYRSQHDNQSWLASLTTVLDACALVITSINGPSTRQAQLTFAIGRHTLVDLGHVFRREEEEQRLRELPFERLHQDEFAQLCEELSKAGFSLCGDKDARKRLDAIRALYEPHACALGHYLCLELPRWIAEPSPTTGKPNAWKSVASLRSPGGLTAALTEHVSQQATASHLGDEDSHRI